MTRNGGPFYWKSAHVTTCTELPRTNPTALRTMLVRYSTYAWGGGYGMEGQRSTVRLPSTDHDLVLISRT